MAGTVLGFMKFVLGFDTIAFKKGMTSAERDLVIMQKKVAAFGKGMTDIGKSMSLAITAPLVAFAGVGVKEAQETAKAMSAVNNALKQTGAVAGQTAPQLQKAADAMELKSLYEGDEILNGVTATLLRFGKIAPQNFMAAQQAAVDYAAASGKDLPAAATAIGKALVDPVKGMKALKDVGVVLDDQQKKQIATWVKAGETGKAQAFVLEQITAKTKDAALAAQNADPFNKLSDAFKQTAEAVGTMLLPFLTQLSDFLVDLAAKFAALTPEQQKWVSITAGIAAAAGPALIVLGTLVSTFAKLGPLVTGLVKVWELLRVAFIAVRVAALATLPALTPFLVPLGLIAAAVTAVYLAWKYWPQITAYVKGVYNAVANYLGAKLQSILNALQHPIEAVTGWFKSMAQKVALNSYVPDMVDVIGQQMARLDSLMVAPTKKATDKTAKAFADLAAAAGPLLDRLFPEKARVNLFNDELATIEATARRLKWTAEQTAEAIHRLTLELVPTDKIGEGDADAMIADALDRLGEIPDEVIPKVKALGEAGKATTADMIEGFGDMAVGVVDSARFMADSLKSGDILGTLLSFLDTVLNVLKTLGQLGVIGGGTGGTTPTPGLAGARARGGPVRGGSSYLVGEKGPEIFSPRRGGYVHPNSAMGQARIMVVPSAYFDVVVDRRAANVAAPIAGQAAVMGMVGGEMRQARLQRRVLP